jgi:hypothetical protein
MAAGMSTGGSSRSYQHGRADQDQEGQNQSPATRLARFADTGPAASSSEPTSSAAFKSSEPGPADETTSSDRTELEKARAPAASLDTSHPHLSAQVEQLAAERNSLLDHVRTLEGQLAETADPREVEGLRVRIREQEAEAEGLRDQAEESRERILSLVSFSQSIFLLLLSALLAQERKGKQLTAPVSRVCRNEESDWRERPSKR